MDHANINWERTSDVTNVRSSGWLLTCLRLLLLPAMVMSVLTLPFFMLATVMITDSGTDESFALAMILLIALCIYAAATPAAFIQWMRWPRLSPTLLLSYAIVNLAAMVMDPDFTAIFPLYLISIATKTDINELSLGVGNVLFIVFCIVIPASGAFAILCATRSERSTESATLIS